MLDLTSLECGSKDVFLGHHDFRLVVTQLLICVTAPRRTFVTAAFLFTVGSVPVSLCVM